MEPGELLDRLQTALTGAKSDGASQVPISRLEDFIESLRKDVGLSVEHRKLLSAHEIAVMNANHLSRIEAFKAAVGAGKEALNALLLINGGAVVALLGFMGALISKGMASALGLQLSSSLLHFGFGVFAGALGFASRYLAQFAFASQWERSGTATNVVSIVVAIVGFVAFGLGLHDAFLAFNAQFKH